MDLVLQSEHTLHLKQISSLQLYIKANFIDLSDLVFDTKFIVIQSNMKSILSFVGITVNN